MVISQNFFKVDNKLKLTLFTEHSNENYVLDYYSFNILLSQTKNQNTIYHSLTDEFFNQFAFHKTKMFFCGSYLNDTFTPTEINYMIPTNKMGIYVKKRLISAFKERGIDLIIKKKMAGEDKMTRLIIL